ncbi:MAG: thioredoxin-disulfide reductase [Caulobacterales bacterium]|nr:thioredoxin-disulfide reductase [Caulobacterales bacterium]MCA0371381.1 thioredoxin-disulfide reductase [Pseudomonadota bacterium]
MQKSKGIKVSDTKHTKVLIIGSGPAGYTAAIYAARAMNEPILVEGPQPGGQLTITTEVENYPGFEHEIQGPWLMEQMKAQALRMGTNVISDWILSVDFSKRPFTAIGDSGTTYTADTVIVSTGAQAKWLGLPEEKSLMGFGVSACATCDGFFYRGKEVVVVGGGNTAVEEALFLTNFASKVTLVHRRNEFRAEKIMQNRVFANPKIEIIWDSAIDEILAEGEIPGVTGVRLKNVKTGETSKVPCDGVFVAIGHAPSTEIFKGQLAMKDNGYLIVEAGTTKTNVAGVFACGDVTDEHYRQAVTAAGMGCMAALDAERFLAEGH